MRKTNLIPLIIMLTAGLIACLISIKMDYDSTRSMIIIFASMLLFYGIGLIAKGIISSNVKQMEKREAEKRRLEEERKKEEEARLAEEQATEEGTQAT